MTNIVQINPKEYGLSETKAQEVSAMFKPMLEKMEELETEFNHVMKKADGEITPEVTQAAKEVRLKYVKVRTGTAKIHKELKAFYLQGGRFVDGWKNAQLMASQGKEEKLKEIEEYYERIEAERIEKLQADRADELAKYQDEGAPTPGNLGEMDAPVWANFIAGAKANHEARLEAERKAEAERVAREKAEAEERERIRKENERLKAEAAERDRLAKIEAEKQAKAEAERRAEMQRIEEENRKRIEAERIAREKAEAEARRLREEEEARAKAEAERLAKAEAERKAKEEAERKKGDAQKIKDMIEAIAAIRDSAPEVKSKSAKSCLVRAVSHLDSAIDILSEC